MKTVVTQLSAVLLILLTFGFAGGAPKDTIVIAQGVDPTTLDPQTITKRRRSTSASISSIPCSSGMKS